MTSQISAFNSNLVKYFTKYLVVQQKFYFRCSFCGIIFDSISHRERHEQRHKDNDTFQCEDCSKMFKNEKNLRHHERPHPKKDNQPKPAKIDHPKDDDDPNANSPPASASGSGGSR